MTRADKGRPRVAVVGGARTPFAKAGTALSRYSALELGTHSVDGALQKLRLSPSSVDQLAFGVVVLNPAVPHLAREINFRSALPPEVQALTIVDNCISGTSAIISVHDAIVTNRAEIGLAGGVDSMSNPPVMFSPHASRLFLESHRSRTWLKKFRSYARLRPSDLVPWSYGAVEPSTGLSMGDHTELTVKEWAISREAQDSIAYRSHMNANAATMDGRLASEIHPLGGHHHDLVIRPTTSLELLAALPPAFDRTSTGTLTAGNSSPLTDGAATVVLMAEHRAAELGYEPLAYIRDFINVGIDPKDGLLMGPGVAVPRLLKSNGLGLDDFDIVEMHEAFGGQVAANLAAWERGWKEPAIGRVDPERLNPLGSSIAIGHPFAATGARIVLTLAHELHRRNARLGLVSICGAGGTAVAMILERS